MARSVIAAAALWFLAATLTLAQAPPAWPDTFVARVEALALMQTLNAEILGSRSATQTLEKWCGDHRLAEEPKIVAHLIRGVDKPPSSEQRQRLPAASTGVLAIPDALFAHRAVLYTRDHVPFSEVYEVYQRQILAFPPPPLR